MTPRERQDLETMADGWEAVQHVSPDLAAAHCAEELRRYLSREVADTDPHELAPSSAPPSPSPAPAPEAP